MQSERNHVALTRVTVQTIRTVASGVRAGSADVHRNSAMPKKGKKNRMKGRIKVHTRARGAHRQQGRLRGGLSRVVRRTRCSA